MARAKQIILTLMVTVLIIGTALMGAGCTVVRISDGKILSGGKETDAYVGSDEFDAETYIESVWEEQALPYVEENAQPYGELMQAIAADFHTAGGQYGNTHSSNAKNYSFLMHANCKVLEYNDESRVGYLSMDVQPYDGQEDFKVYVGPVFKGDALRNALKFIKFTDFTSQNDWAKVSKSLHAKVNDTLISTLDLPSMQDAEIELYGAFTVVEGEEDAEQYITPVTIKTAEG